MSSVIISGDTSGTVSVTVPAVAGTNTVTIPAATGTVMVSGNMPAFSAYLLASQSVSNSTWTKVTLNTEEFDTASCFNNTGSTVGSIPAYAFLPNVAGYYQIGMTISGNSGSYAQELGCAIYKNATRVKWAQNSYSSEIINVGGPTISTIISMNGTTDYLEMYGFCQASLAPAFRAISGTSQSCYMSGSLIRGA